MVRQSLYWHPIWLYVRQQIVKNLCSYQRWFGSRLAALSVVEVEWCSSRYVRVRGSSMTCLASTSTGRLRTHYVHGVRCTVLDQFTVIHCINLMESSCQQPNSSRELLFSQRGLLYTTLASNFDMKTSKSDT